MNNLKKLQIYMMYESGAAFLDIATTFKVTVREAADACSDVQDAKVKSKETVKVVQRKRLVKKDDARRKILVEKMKTLG